MADKIKKVLTAKALQAIRELNQEGCVTTLDIGVRSVFLLAYKLFVLVHKPCADK
jgi:hypothetical protein